MRMVTTLAAVGMRHRWLVVCLMFVVVALADVVEGALAEGDSSLPVKRLINGALGKITKESKVEYRDKSNIKLPDGFTFFPGNYRIDTYSLVVSNGKSEKVVWSRKSSTLQELPPYPCPLLNMLVVLDFEQKGEKTYVLFSDHGNAILDVITGAGKPRSVEITPTRASEQFPQGKVLLAGDRVYAFMENRLGRARMWILGGKRASSSGSPILFRSPTRVRSSRDTRGLHSSTRCAR